MIQNKRGLSEVISNVLIVLVTVAAVAVLAPFLISFVRDNLDQSTQCSVAEKSFLFDRSLSYNCVDKISSTSYNLYPSLKVLNDDEEYDEVYSSIQGFSFSVFYEDGTSEQFYVPGDNVKMLPEDATAIIPPAGGSKTYNISTSKEVDKVEVSPILTGNYTCQKTDVLEEINLCN